MLTEELNLRRKESISKETQNTSPSTITSELSDPPSDQGEDDYQSIKTAPSIRSTRLDSSGVNEEEGGAECGIGGLTTTGTQLFQHHDLKR